MSLEELARRIQVLEDIEALKKLKARYCAYCDNHYDADGLAALFTEDAVWDGGERLGRSEGREAIRAFFQGAPTRLPFAIHHVTNPFIDVHGDTATGRWYLFQPCTRAEGNRAVWLAARYEEDYVRQGGEWKFRQMRIFPAFYTPYDQGWVKQQFI
jgi:ketosteroid isomerase-like protein